MREFISCVVWGSPTTLGLNWFGMCVVVVQEEEEEDEQQTLVITGPDVCLSVRGEAARPLLEYYERNHVEPAFRTVDNIPIAMLERLFVSQTRRARAKAPPFVSAVFSYNPKYKAKVWRVSQDDIPLPDPSTAACYVLDVKYHVPSMIMLSQYFDAHEETPPDPTYSNLLTGSEFYNVVGQPLVKKVFARLADKWDRQLGLQGMGKYQFVNSWSIPNDTSIKFDGSGYQDHCVYICVPVYRYAPYTELGERDGYYCRVMQHDDKHREATFKCDPHLVFAYIYHANVKSITLGVPAEVPGTLLIAKYQYMSPVEHYAFMVKKLSFVKNPVKNIDNILEAIISDVMSNYHEPPVRPLYPCVVMTAPIHRKFCQLMWICIVKREFRNNIIDVSSLIDRTTPVHCVNYHMFNEEALQYMFGLGPSFAWPTGVGDERQFVRLPIAFNGLDVVPLQSEVVVS